MIIIHDFFKINGGGEKLILGIANHFNIKIKTFFKTNYHKNNTNIIAPFFSRLFSIFNPLSCFIYFRYLFSTKSKEIIFYSGNFSILSINNNDSKRHIFYIHTLPKKLFYNYYLESCPWYLKLFNYFFFEYFYNIYKDIYQKADIIIFNSENTKKQFINTFFVPKNYHILNPYFQSVKTKINSGNMKKPSFIFNSRHELNKGILPVVDFFYSNKNYLLYLTNEGSLTSFIKNKYNSNNIIFLGHLNEDEYHKLIVKSYGVIMFPHNEDFGMSALDAICNEKILICPYEGGLKEIISKNYPFIIDRGNFYINLKKCLELAIKYEGNYKTNINKFTYVFFFNKLKKIIYKGLEK